MQKWQLSAGRVGVTHITLSYSNGLRVRRCFRRSRQLRVIPKAADMVLPHAARLHLALLFHGSLVSAGDTWPLVPCPRTAGIGIWAGWVEESHLTQVRGRDSRSWHKQMSACSRKEYSWFCFTYPSITVYTGQRSRTIYSWCNWITFLWIGLLVWLELCVTVGVLMWLWMNQRGQISLSPGQSRRVIASFSDVLKTVHLYVVWNMSLGLQD